MVLEDDDDTTTTSEFHLALATSKKFEEAMRYKKMYEELSQGFMGLIKETLRFLDDNGIESRQRRRIDRIVENAYNLYSTRLEAAASPDAGHPSESPSDGTMPIFIHK